MLAIGQMPETAIFKDSRITLKKGGAVEVNGRGRTASCGVYAGGDAATGPAIVIAACADGIRAAEAICEELDIPVPCDCDELPRLSGEDILKIKLARTMKVDPHQEAHLPVKERKGFELVEQTLSEADARAEAERCLQCTAVCDKCVEVCPNRANYSYTSAPFYADAPILAMEAGQVVIVDSEGVAI